MENPTAESITTTLTTTTTTAEEASALLATLPLPPGFTAVNTAALVAAVTTLLSPPSPYSAEVGNEVLRFIIERCRGALAEVSLPDVVGLLVGGKWRLSGSPGTGGIWSTQSTLFFSFSHHIHRILRECSRVGFGSEVALLEEALQHVLEALELVLAPSSGGTGPGSDHHVLVSLVFSALSASVEYLSSPPAFRFRAAVSTAFGNSTLFSSLVVEALARTKEGEDSEELARLWLSVSYMMEGMISARRIPAPNNGGSNDNHPWWEYLVLSSKPLRDIITVPVSRPSNLSFASFSPDTVRSMPVIVFAQFLACQILKRAFVLPNSTQQANQRAIADLRHEIVDLVLEHVLPPVDAGASSSPESIPFLPILSKAFEILSVALERSPVGIATESKAKVLAALPRVLTHAVHCAALSDNATQMLDESPERFLGNTFLFEPRRDVLILVLTQLYRRSSQWSPDAVTAFRFLLETTLPPLLHKVMDGITSPPPSSASSSSSSPSGPEEEEGGRIPTKTVHSMLGAILELFTIYAKLVPTVSRGGPREATPEIMAILTSVFASGGPVEGTMALLRPHASVLPDILLGPLSALESMAVYISGAPVKVAFERTLQMLQEERPMYTKLLLSRSLATLMRLPEMDGFAKSLSSDEAQSMVEALLAVIQSTPVSSDEIIMVLPELLEKAPDLLVTNLPLVIERMMAIFQSKIAQLEGPAPQMEDDFDIFETRIMDALGMLDLVELTLSLGTGYKHHFAAVRSLILPPLQSAMETPVQADVSDGILRIVAQLVAMAGSLDPEMRAIIMQLLPFASFSDIIATLVDADPRDALSLVHSVCQTGNVEQTEILPALLSALIGTLLPAPATALNQNAEELNMLENLWNWVDNYRSSWGLDAFGPEVWALVDLVFQILLSGLITSAIQGTPTEHLTKVLGSKSTSTPIFKECMASLALAGVIRADTPENAEPFVQALITTSVLPSISFDPDQDDRDQDTDSFYNDDFGDDMYGGFGSAMAAMGAMGGFGPLGEMPQEGEMEMPTEMEMEMEMAMMNEFNNNGGAGLFADEIFGASAVEDIIFAAMPESFNLISLILDNRDAIIRNGGSNQDMFSGLVAHLETLTTKVPPLRSLALAIVAKAALDDPTVMEDPRLVPDVVRSISQRIAFEQASSSSSSSAPPSTNTK